MTAIFLSTFVAVLTAELTGDRLLLAVGVLAARFRHVNVACGVAAALMVKMLAAVVLGSSVAYLPKSAEVLVTAVAFFSVAYRLNRPQDDYGNSASYGGVVESFSATVFSEWGDVGQLTTAAMAARFQSPVVVWSAAVAAMFTKSVIAITMMTQVRRWYGAQSFEQSLRRACAGVFAALGLISVAEIVLR